MVSPLIREALFHNITYYEARPGFGAWNRVSGRVLLKTIEKQVRDPVL